MPMIRPVIVAAALTVVLLSGCADSAQGEPTAAGPRSPAGQVTGEPVVEQESEGDDWSASFGEPIAFTGWEVTLGEPTPWTPSAQYFSQAEEWGDPTYDTYFTVAVSAVNIGDAPRDTYEIGFQGGDIAIEQTTDVEIGNPTLQVAPGKTATWTVGFGSAEGVERSLFITDDEGGSWYVS